MVKLTASTDPLAVAVSVATGGEGVVAALRVWLARGLIENRHTGLEGASIDPRDRLRIAEVFEDVAIDRDESRFDEDTGEARLTPGALAALLADEGPRHPLSKRSPRSESAGTVERVVLIGGPGQGKSTIVQHLAQVHRAAWLDPHRDALDDTERETVARVLARCGPETWPRPGVLRLPFVVPLGALASWRAGARTEPRFIEYLAAWVARSGAVTSAETLTKLLQTTPWLLVLDGLDEVPSSAGRAETLAMVERFLHEMSATRGLVVGTTRPQGYGREFGAAEELRLAELSTPRALAYAKRLVAQWMHREPDAQRVLSRLEGAMNEEGTAQLTRTPLHVTLLAVFLFQHTRAPRERWRLFEEFYNSVYAREARERDRSAGYGDLLRQRRTDIDDIHQRAGLHLQCLGERVDGAEALLTEREFERIIDARLQEVGVPDRKRGERVREVLAATTERLVLLAQVRARRYGFDLRSLQEFMAARALCKGTDDQVEARVRHVAVVPYWRNVVLLVVGYVFTHSVDALKKRLTLDLCRWLDESPEVPFARTRRRGALLALEILEEGSVSLHPALVAPLAEIALGVLGLPERETARVEAVLTKLEGDPDVGDEIKVLRVRHALALFEDAEATRSEVWWPWGPPSSQVNAIQHNPGVYALFVTFRHLPTLDANDAGLAEMKAHPERRPAVWAAEFVREGNAAALARVLGRFARDVPAELWKEYARKVPWPLGACLMWCADPVRLQALADAASRGELGDRADWDAAENRWANAGVRLDELLPAESALPFTAEVRARGFVPWVASFDVEHGGWDPFKVKADEGAMSFNQYISAMLDWRAVSPERRIPPWFIDSLAPLEPEMTVGVGGLSASAMKTVLRDVPVTFAQVRNLLDVSDAIDTKLLESLVGEFPDHLVLDPSFWYENPTSRMLDPEHWKSLGLPAPSPPEPSGLLFDRVEQVVRFEVTDLRLFERLAFELPEKRWYEFHWPESGTPVAPWLVLLGENSVGKTTLLRALALALVDPADATAMLTDSRSPWRREDGRDATVTVNLPRQTYTVTITRGETERETLRSVSDPANGAARERPFVVGYGCRRGAADGGRDQKVMVERLDDIGTLFDAPGRALVLAEAWLKDLELFHLKNEAGTAHLFDVVREVLVGDLTTGREGVLPGVDSLEIRDATVWFKGPAVGSHGTPLAALSDGYITTTGWVIDMMARWVHRQRVQRKLAVPRRFNEAMTGFALVDEIDLHLHPRWQREVIPTVRRIFPRMSFVVTTHNPLTLVGAAGCELRVLRRARDTGRVEATALTVPTGLRADQVLTGEWFGLATTLDPETFDLWERHYRALREGLKAGDPSLHELERQLATRLGTYASTSVDRIAIDVATRVMDEMVKEHNAKGPVELTPEQRSVVFDRVLAFVREESQKADGSKGEA